MVAFLCTCTAYFSATFVTIAMVKVKIQDFYTLSILVIYKWEEIDEKQRFSYLMYMYI